MPLFESFSEIIASLTPRRPRRGLPDDRQRSDAQHRHSVTQHEASLNPRRRSRSPFSRASRRINTVQAELSLGSEPDNDRLSEPRSSSTTRHTAAHLQTTQSYANGSPFDPGPATTRGQLRPPLSQFVIDPTARGDPSHMLGKDQRRQDAQARQEEARLLGAKDYKDKDAVPITPGASLQRNRKVPGSTAAFKPTDRISQHSRDSGPVRASGKSKPGASYLRRNPPQLADAPEFGESSRPSKRRRHDDHDGPFDVADQGLTNQVSSSPGIQYSAKLKSNGWTARQHDEFRGVEDSIKVDRSPRASRRAHHIRFSSRDSHDEHFTSIAAQQRRSHTLNAEITSPQTSMKLEQPQRDVLESIERPKAKDSLAETQVHRKYLPSNGPRRVSDARESSDELQGEATTQPVPKNLDEKHNQTRHRFINEHPKPAVRKRSPTDIQPTDFAGSPPQGPKKAKRNHQSSGISSLEVLSVRFGAVNKRAVKGESVAIRLDQEKLELGEDVAGPESNIDILLRHVRVVYRGKEPSLKVRLRLSQSAEAPGDNIVDIEFLTQSDKEKLVRALQHMQAKIQDKEQTFMEKAFTNLERELAQHGSHTKRTFRDTSAAEPASPPPASSSTRQKISSSLQDPTGEPSGSKRLQSKSNPQENVDSVHGAGESREICDDRKRESDEGVEIPVKPFRPTQPERETRSTARRTTRLSERSSARDDTFDFERQSSPKDDEFRQKWKKPLVYPWIGKKKAEVSVEDRDRLREGEFLNDNLIGFYMRFLQDHLERTNKKAAKQVYFFNSYFFDTLTNSPKGERGINYSGVEKWTRSVDLFSYDYIVVPINQNAHWYVAIICNLPSLELGTADGVEPSSAAVSDNEASNPPEGEVQEILESPEPEPAPSAPADADSERAQRRNSESPASQVTRQSLASMTLVEDGQAPKESEKQEEPAEAEEWPEGEENPTSPPAKFSSWRQKATETQAESASASRPGRKTKKKGKAGPKLSPTQTTIITFDSLDLGRSPTIGMLREYICKEAESKRGVEVDPASIKGMRARQIPLQPNYSDCGLYLLAYVEKFAQNPDEFATKLLQRDMDENDDWPPLGSGLLRHRLRNFLDDLYKEQARRKGDKTASQPIMADQQPVSFLLGPPLLSHDDVDDQNTAEPAPALDPQVSKVEAEKHAAQENTAEKGDDANDVSATDQPELVPIASAPDTKSAKDEEPSAPPAKDAVTTRRSDPPEAQVVVEVPDSQEIRPAPEPKLSRAEKKKIRKGEEAPSSRKSERKKAAVPADTEVVNVDNFLPDNPAKGSRPEVQIQVRQTPPPEEPERKGPRGRIRKD